MTVFLVDPDDDTDPVGLNPCLELFDNKTKSNYDGAWSDPKAGDPPMKGSLKLIKYTSDKQWALIRSGATREEKWVNVYDIWTEGVLDAFYDADPTFLPSGEKN